MKTIWKIIIGLIFMLLGFALWISTSIIEAFAQLADMLFHVYGCGDNDRSDVAVFCELNHANR